MPDGHVHTAHSWQRTSLHMWMHLAGYEVGCQARLACTHAAYMAASSCECRCATHIAYSGLACQARLARTHPTSMAASAACTCRCTCVASSATPLPTAQLLQLPIVPTLLPKPLHCQRLVDHSTALGPQQLPLHHCSALVFSTLYQGGSAHRLPRSHREQVQAAPSSNPSVDNASTLAWTLTSRRP
jgi:hypothetical protein